MSNLGWKLALVGCCLAVIAFIVLALDWHTVYATPERESAFLKAYSPDTTIKQFASPRWIQSIGSSKGSEAGNGVAIYKNYFDARFAMRSSDRQAFMTALANSVENGVLNSGAQLIQQTGSDAAGYSFKYVDGKSAGTISLGPIRQLDADHLGGKYGGPTKKSLHFVNPGEVPVEVEMSIAETWTK